MSYYLRVWARAWTDTWGLVVDAKWPSIAVGGVAFVISAGIYWRWMGVDQMSDMLVSAGIGIIATALIFICVFIFYVLFLSPKHLFEEKEKEANDLKAQLSSARQKQLSAIDEMYEAVVKLIGRTGRKSYNLGGHLEAMLGAGAHRLESNDDILAICDRLQSNDFANPFHIYGLDPNLIPRSQYLKFLKFCMETGEYPLGGTLDIQRAAEKFMKGGNRGTGPAS